MKFLGHIIGENGLKPDPNKVKDINSFLKTGTVTDVSRFLGMTNQLGKFLPKLSDVTKPLHELISHQNVFHWGPAQESAFQEVKHILSSAPVLALYDMKRETIISTDSSSFGLGAVLLHRLPDNTICLC